MGEREGGGGGYLRGRRGCWGSVWSGWLTLFYRITRTIDGCGISTPLIVTQYNQLTLI